MKIKSDDPTATQRKSDHIDLAFQSAVGVQSIDRRFRYEPMLSAHPTEETDLSLEFLGKTMRAPIWVSSMTGGTDHANKINHQLARVCGEFGLGMGLGSCRMLLESNDRLADFDVRGVLGDQSPLYTNLGIAQIEAMIKQKSTDQINELIIKLKADGLIIHVNPLQEWLQPEGDLISRPPIETIQEIMDLCPARYIVKEVGQGMGPESLRRLLKLPIEAIEFAAHGGTNFSKLEMLRGDQDEAKAYDSLALVGHDAAEMTRMINQLTTELDQHIKCKQVIISGGVKTFLDGYYLVNKINLTAIYGQASAFLKYAQGDYQDLQAFVKRQIDGLKLAQSYLRVV